MATKKIKFKKLRPNATIPTRGSEFAAGLDVYACIDNPVTIYPGEVVKIRSGVACEPPKGYCEFMVVRSSVGIKRNLGLANDVGIIDEDYNGEIIVALYNYGNTPQIIEPNERLAQLIFLQYLSCPIEEVEELTETDRGEGGIGSTGR